MQTFGQLDLKVCSYLLDQLLSRLGRELISMTFYFSSLAYMSLAVTGFPNMLIQCGPGTIFANGSLLSGIEASSAYIVKAL